MLKDIKDSVMYIECPKCKADYTHNLTEMTWQTRLDGKELSNIMTFCECGAMTGFNMNLCPNEFSEFKDMMSSQEEREYRLLLELREEVQNGN